jgi:uroporphyrinogen decarboxylase
MTYRERFERTMQHRSVDRPPMDFYGTSLTSCADPVLNRLADLLDLPGSTKTERCENLQQVFDVDFRRVGMLFEPQSDYLDYSRLAQGIYTDSWGIVRRYQGMYWDIVKSPLKDWTLQELKEYRFPDASGIDRSVIRSIQEQAIRLFYDTGYVIAAEHPVYGYLELGCWMFGFDDFLYRLLAEPETVEWFFSQYDCYVKDVTELYYGTIGSYIHLTTSGDDFGMQNGLLISPDTFHQQIRPWYEKRINRTKKLTKAAYFHHSCGSVYRLMDELIGMGVDILNPIQPGALEMEPERLKSHYGDRLVFWGGIDEQGLLSHGTPGMVTEEVHRVSDIMSRNGGWVLSASHNIQPDVPPENVLAMFQALHAYR